MAQILVSVKKTVTTVAVVRLTNLEVLDALKKAALSKMYSDPDADTEHLDGQPDKTEVQYSGDGYTDHDEVEARFEFRWEDESE